MNWLMLVYALFRVDRYSKKWAEDNLKIGDEPVPAADGKLMLVRKKNEGIVGGKMANTPERAFVLSAVSAAMIGLNFISEIFRKGGIVSKIASSLMAAGAAGNFHDRWARGSVTDFVSVPKAPGALSKAVFNVADVFIVLGGLLMIPIKMFRGPKSGK